MSESLWNNLDTFLVNRIRAAMGTDSAHPTLKLQRVDTALTWDVAEWEDWPKPAVAVMGYERSAPGYGPHGDGVAHLEPVYRYVLLVMDEGTQQAAQANVKTLLTRLDAVIRDLYTDINGLGPDSYGERPANIEVGSTAIGASRVQSSQASRWIVLGGIDVRFVTEV